MSQKMNLKELEEQLEEVIYSDVPTPIILI